MFIEALNLWRLHMRLIKKSWYFLFYIEVIIKPFLNYLSSLKNKTKLWKLAECRNLKVDFQSKEFNDSPYSK